MPFLFEAGFCRTQYFLMSDTDPIFFSRIDLVNLDPDPEPWNNVPSKEGLFLLIKYLWKIFSKGHSFHPSEIEYVPATAGQLLVDVSIAALLSRINMAILLSRDFDLKSNRNCGFKVFAWTSQCVFGSLTSTPISISRWWEENYSKHLLGDLPAVPGDKRRGNRGLGADLLVSPHRNILFAVSHGSVRVSYRIIYKGLISPDYKNSPIYKKNTKSISKQDTKIKSNIQRFRVFRVS